MHAGEARGTAVISAIRLVSVGYGFGLRCQLRRSRSKPKALILNLPLWIALVRTPCCGVSMARKKSAIETPYPINYLSVKLSEGGDGSITRGRKNRGVDCP